MDKANTSKPSTPDRTPYVLVLTKLKQLLVNGFYLADELRYVYTWDDTKSKDENRRRVMQEDAALKYFCSIGVVQAERMENEFRSQELRARAFDPDDRVWAEWDKVDAAYREYEWVVEVHGIDSDKFLGELGKFGLEDTGIELIELEAQSKIAPIRGRFGQFTAHKDGSIRYKGKLVRLKPDGSHLVYALILGEGSILRYDQIVDALWNEEYGNQGYLEDPSRKRGDITKRIGNIVSEANRALQGYGDKKHLIAAGETSYRLVV